MKNKIQYFENLRVIALLAVVSLHVDRQLIAIVTKHSIDSSWLLPISLWGICLFAVPAMLMQSGYLLLHPSKDESTLEFFKKRILKIFLPIATWTLIYMGFIFVTDHTRITHLMYLTVTDKIYHHMWYVYTLLGLYLMTPILRKYIKAADMNNIAYLLVLWFFVTAINPAIKKFLGYEIHVELSYLFGYIGYFILGYYLQNSKISKNVRLIIYLLGLVGLVISVLLTYSISKHVLDRFFEEYKSFATITYAIAVFVWAKYSKIMNTIDLSWNGKLNIGRICFGVYLGHALVIDTLAKKFNFQVIPSNPIGSFILVSIVVSIITFGFFIILDLLNKYKAVKIVSKLLY
jgi:surface polysaccharide O-acyltransferase-like enzyme